MTGVDTGGQVPWQGPGADDGFVLDPGDGGIDVTRVRGPVGEAALIAAGCAYATRAMSPGTLWDRTDAVAESKADRTRVGDVAGPSAPRYPDLAHRRVAHLVTSDLAFGFLRMRESLFGLQIEGGPDRSPLRDARVVRNRSSPMAWLRAGNPTDG